MKQEEINPEDAPKSDEAKTIKVAADEYGSGYNNKRDDYRSKKINSSKTTDTSSHTTKEANIHRSEQHNQLNNTADKKEGDNND